jgi:hypothetical protein
MFFDTFSLTLAVYALIAAISIAWLGLKHQ